MACTPYRVSLMRDYSACENICVSGDSVFRKHKRNRARDALYLRLQLLHTMYKDHRSRDEVLLLSDMYQRVFNDIRTRRRQRKVLQVMHETASITPMRREYCRTDEQFALALRYWNMRELIPANAPVRKLLGGDLVDGLLAQFHDARTSLLEPSSEGWRVVLHAVALSHAEFKAREKPPIGAKLLIPFWVLRRLPLDEAAAFMWIANAGSPRAWRQGARAAWMKLNMTEHITGLTLQRLVRALVSLNNRGWILMYVRKKTIFVSTNDVAVLVENGYSVALDGGTIASVAAEARRKDAARKRKARAKQRRDAIAAADAAGLPRPRGPGRPRRAVALSVPDPVPASQAAPTITLDREDEKWLREDAPALAGEVAKACHNIAVSGGSPAIDDVAVLKLAVWRAFSLLNIDIDLFTGANCATQREISPAGGGEGLRRSDTGDAAAIAAGCSGGSREEQLVYGGAGEAAGEQAGAGGG